jgi:hypothetical protein
VKIKVKQKFKILLGVNLVPFKDNQRIEMQQLCVESINKLKPMHIVPLNICYPDETIMPPGWEVANVLVESADKKLNTQGKRKPFVSDLFNAAADYAKKHGIDWFIISNSDIFFTPNLIYEVRKLLKEKYQTIAISRTDMKYEDNQKVMRLERRGYDVFLCQTSWWDNNRHLFQPYIFGEQAWDDAYAAIMACHSKFHILYTSGLCFHIEHGHEWQDTGPYADYNMSLFKTQDRFYGERFYPFMDEVSSLHEKLLSFEKTALLIKKHFHIEERAIHGSYRKNS